MPSSLLHSMFHLPLPVLEKIGRPVVVYLSLIFFLRLFGKRELAQLNPFDLVVLLCLANTVQNGIIGDDNSLTGGIIGAFSLLAINWLLMRFLYRFPQLNRAFAGTETSLIQDGKADRAAMKREGLTDEELLSVLHKNGFDMYEEVRRCVLEPSGTFYVEPIKPSAEDLDRRSIVDAVSALQEDVRALRAELAAARGGPNRLQT